MAALAIARLELKGLWRIAGLPISIALVLAVVVVHVQEPTFVRRFQIAFFWQSIDAVLGLALVLAPLTWVLTRRQEAACWSRRAVRAVDPVIGGWLGVVGFGLGLTAVAVAAAITVRSIVGLTPSPSTVLDTGARAICWVLPTAALAPALAHVRLRPALVILVWAGLVCACLGIFGRGMPIPLDSLLGDRIEGTESSGRTLLVLAETTTAGILVSLAAAGIKRRY